MGIKLKEYCKHMNMIKEDSKQTDMFKKDSSKGIFSKFIADILFLSIKGDVEEAAKRVHNDPSLVKMIRTLNRDSRILAQSLKSQSQSK
jgi:hypothetical protein